MRHTLLNRLLVPAIACSLAMSCAVAAAAAAPSAEQSRAGTSADARKAGAAQKRKARQAQRRRQAHRAAKRRFVRQQRRSGHRHSVGNQVALASKKSTAAAENPEVLFRGDFETGFDGWHVQSISSRATLLASGPFQGGGAARFEVQDGDVEPETGSERSEVSGPTFDEGQDLYIRDAIRIPSASSFEGEWQIVQQLHESDWDGSPGIAVFLDEDNVLSIGSGDGSTTYWEGTELEHDRWYDLVYRVYLSQDSSAGFVEVWLNGAPQTLEGGGPRAYGETIQAERTYLKAGIYRGRSSTGTSLVEHDAIVVGSSLAAVTAG